MNSPMTEAMYYVLLALMRPAHGYALMQQIRLMSGGRMTIGPGTLYGILSRMQAEQWITLEEADGRRKTYAITEQGKQALRQEYARLQCLLRDGAFLTEQTVEEDEQ